MSIETPRRAEQSLPAEGDPRLRRARVVAGDAYFPSFAREERRGRRFVCGADEDAVTMAVDAAAGALAAWGGDPAAVDGLYIAAASGAGVEAPQQQVIREALGISDRARVVGFLPDPLAGLDAMQAALDTVAGGSLETVLVVASEGDGEAARNAAAVALIVSSVDSGAAGGIAPHEFGRASTLTHERIQTTALDPREPDFRFLAHRYEAVVAKLSDAFVADGSEPPEDLVFIGGSVSSQRTLRAQLFPDAGPGPGPGADFGVAGPLLAVLGAPGALPGRRIGLIAYGAGQAVALGFVAPADCGAEFGSVQPPAEPREPLASSEVGPALSLPLESPFFARTWGESLRAEGARCTACSHIVFPASQRTICPSCGGHSWEMTPLPREGTVLTTIDNHFLPAGYPKRVISVLAELQDGCNYWAPMPPESRAEDVAIDDRVELRLRIFTSRDGITTYSLKFLPANTKNGDTK